VRRRIEKERRGSFTLKGSNWFPKARGSEKEWRAALRLLEREHRALEEMIGRLKEATLREPRAAKMIAGIAMHDAYHAGQISLLKRMAKRG
jgi:hypothetical protein